MVTKKWFSRALSIPWESQFKKIIVKLIEKALIYEGYLFLSVLDAIFPCANDLSFVSRRWFEAVLVSCLESRRTVSNRSRGLYNKPSWLKSPTGWENDEVKLLLESVPCENIQWRFLRTKTPSAILEMWYWVHLQISHIRAKKRNFLLSLHHWRKNNVSS